MEIGAAQAECLGRSLDPAGLARALDGVAMLDEALYAAEGRGGHPQPQPAHLVRVRVRVRLRVWAWVWVG